MKDDASLLREYVEQHSETAFAELVGRHVNLVYSTALRVVREFSLAEDIVQAVFVQLARKAATLRDGHALPGWLYRAARGQAANAVRAEITRRRHEAEAMMQAEIETEAAWEQVGSGLEDAMAALSPADQNLVVMRFFQGRSWRDVGAALALSEDAAQRRSGRALEKLRAFFARKGFAVSASVLGMTVSVNAVQAAPPGLASSVAAASLAQASAVSPGLLALFKILFMKKSTCVFLGAILVTGAISIPLILANHHGRPRPVTADSLKKGLVLHLTFDANETDERVTDVSGSGNHGRASGVRWTAEGKRGGAYEFTADGNAIVVPNQASLNPAQLTLAAWIKTSYTDSRWRRIFDKAYSDGYALSIAADWQGNKWAGLASLEIGPGSHLDLTKDKVADGQWHQLVATFDGIEQALYLDGQLQNQLHWDLVGRPGTNNFDLVIGCNRSNLKEDDLGMSFRGLIDEPMVWDRDLTPNEVAFLYESQR